MICANCGSNIPDGSTICLLCGANVQQTQPQYQQPQYQQPQYQQPQYQQPQYQQPQYQQPQYQQPQYQQPQYRQPVYQTQQMMGPNYTAVTKAYSNAKVTMLLGIISIFLTAGTGLGFILAIIALVKEGKKPRFNLSQLTPDEQVQYNAALGNFKIGKICSIISLILTGIIIVLFIFAISSAV